MDELAVAGAKRISHGEWLARVATGGWLRAAQEMKDLGTFGELNNTASGKDVVDVLKGNVSTLACSPTLYEHEVSVHYFRRFSTSTPDADNFSIAASSKPCSVRTSRACAENLGGVDL